MRPLWVGIPVTCVVRGWWGCFIGMIWNMMYRCLLLNVRSVKEIKLRPWARRAFFNHFPFPIRCGMDFISGLPKSHCFDTILVVVYHFTKFAHFLPLHHPYSTKSVAVVFIKDVVKLHGFPRSIVSDRDRVFTSTFWQEIFKEAGTRLCYSTTYHP